MWRDTPVANTNHHLSNIKSSDMVTWKTMAGQNLTLPITQSTAGVVADPISTGNGLINMDFWISWDSQKRAVLTYHRYDNNNISQIWNTRWENNAWKIYQTSSWTSFKWNLDLQGSLAHDIAATPLEIDERGRLLQIYVYRDKIKRQWVLNESTLKPLSDSVWQPPAGQEEIYRVESTFDSMMVNLKQDNYWIKWETMPINQDVARTSYPSGSTLRLYTMGIQSTVTAPARRIDVRPSLHLDCRNRGSRPAPGAARVALIALDGSRISESGENVEWNHFLFHAGKRMLYSQDRGTEERRNILPQAGDPLIFTVNENPRRSDIMREDYPLTQGSPQCMKSPNT